MRRMVLLLLLCSSTTYAWDDCPFGLVDDPTPGQCRLYVDANQDGICDRSQKKPEPAEDRPVPAVIERNASASTTGSGNPRAAAARPTSIQRPQATATPDSVRNPAPLVIQKSQPEPQPARARPGRYLWLIFITTALLAAATEWLSSAKKILSFRLQSIWNWLLLVFFLLSAGTGLYLIMAPAQTNPGLALQLYRWHVETGMVFVAIGAYHALRRFGCMLRGLGACFHRK